MCHSHWGRGHTFTHTYSDGYTDSNSNRDYNSDGDGHSHFNTKADTYSKARPNATAAADTGPQAVTVSHGSLTRPAISELFRVDHNCPQMGCPRVTVGLE